MNYRIETSKTTPDKKHLFVSDYKGNLKQICLRTQTVTHDYGNMTDGSSGIFGMATTSEYVFLGCAQQLKQCRIDDHELVKSYPFQKDIISVITTFDSRHAFVGLTDGSLHQICIDSQTVIKDYGVNDGGDFVISMAVTRDNNFLITGLYTGTIKKISIPNQKVVKDFDRICDWMIVNMQLAPGDESLSVYDEKCNLKLVDTTDGTTIHDLGRAFKGDNGA